MFSRDSKRKLALTPDLPFSVISVFSVSQDFNAGNWDTKRLVIAFLLRNSQARPNFPRHLRALKKTMMVLMTTVSRPERTILAWELRSSMLVSVTMGRKQMFLAEYRERMEGVTLCQCPLSLLASPGIVPALNLYHWNSQMIHQVTAFLYQYYSLLS